MKYSTHINLAGIDHYGLSNCTDLDDWLILDYIDGWSRSLGTNRRGDYVWINLKTALEQMPILRVKTKAGLSKRIKRLTEIDLLASFQDEEDKRLFVKLTELYREIRRYQEIVDGVNSGKQGVNSGKHSLVNYENSTSSSSTKGDGAEIFSMTIEWEPDQILLESILRKAGFSLDQVDRIWKAEFVTYWWGYPERRLTHEAWTWRLGLRLLDYLRDPGLFDRLHGIYTQDQ